MIYTIGYDHMKGTSELLRAIDSLSIERVIDCRSVPTSRHAGFGGRQLHRLLFHRYEARGHELGGRGAGPTKAGLDYLATLPDSPNVLLLCKEESPAACHRHRDIAIPLYRKHGLDCTHIFRDELIRASELQSAIDEDRDYDCLVAPWSED